MIAKHCASRIEPIVNLNETSLRYLELVTILVGSQWEELQRCSNSLLLYVVQRRDLLNLPIRHHSPEMPITALPSETVRSIGSTQIFSDLCSVIKELIDNSLDACALAISVEVSVNSLDVIQVKDNGPGIHPDDRAMLGKAHCTSKIRSFADLSDIGGKSLGFRGEALASAATICGSMIVSTRIASEPMGVSLTINRQGWIEK